jgi:drug/metabolite transporter (DMT)-like permease
MSQQFIGMMVGGLSAALFYGFSNVFAKAATQSGIAMGWYLFIIGASIACVGGATLLFSPARFPEGGAAVSSALLGCTWATGTVLVALGLSRYGVPLSKLVPLYNLNTLVAVLLALWIFAEWKQVKGLQLISGSVLMIIGGILVSRS